ncbi:MAG: hypothetical protein HQL51_09240 [Magnetococcales bacterium]|nr:hypothetical protein [Magnetococcales bacterium]
MAKTPSQISGELLDQVAKARQVLEALAAAPLDAKGELVDGAAVRARLNAAKAHITRALEKAQSLR